MNSKGPCIFVQVPLFVDRFLCRHRRLRVFQVGTGIQFLDPKTGEPGPIAYAFFGLALALPVYLGVESISSILTFVQAIKGKPDPLDTYDPGAYLPPIY